MAELEEALGVRLLDRTTREVVLTHAGQALAPALERLLGQLDDTLEDTRQLGEHYRGRVVIAGAPTISARLMPMYVAACAAQYPEIRLTVRDNVQADGIEQVRAGGVDFGVLIDPLVHDGLTIEPLVIRPVLLRVPARSSARAGRIRPLVGLGRHAAGAAGLRLEQPAADRSRVRAHHGIVPRVIQELGHSASVFGMVEAGIGASVLPTYVAAAAGGIAARVAAAGAARGAAHRHGPARRSLSVARGRSGMGAGPQSHDRGGRAGA
ncbi:LysR family transcriptional regulator [Cupriavidus basilensis]